MKTYKVTMYRKGTDGEENEFPRIMRVRAERETEAAEFVRRWTKTRREDITDIEVEEVIYTSGIIKAMDIEEHNRRLEKLNNTKTSEKLELEENTGAADHDTDSNGSSDRNDGDDGMHNNASSGAKRSKRKNAER